MTNTRKLLFLSFCAASLSGCIVTPVIKTGTALATGAGKVVGATAGKAIGTTINTVKGSGGQEKAEAQER